MSRRIYIISAFILAAVATIVGWSQTLNHKITPPVPLALWFPLIILTGSTNLTAVALSLIQFPLFAIAFTLGIRRRPVARVAVALTLTYALLAGIAFALVRFR